MTTNAAAQECIRLRTIRPADLPAFLAFWNHAFRERRGYFPLTETIFRRRVLDCPAYQPAGLILAWRRDSEGAQTIAGFIHAFRPPPPTAAYERWGRYHSIAVLYVEPRHRRQGVGSRLLKAAENWLYYCPVHFAGQSVPCYGNVEGPRPPLFGSTQRMGVDTGDKDLLHFLANRGYAVVDPGDVSMSVDLRGRAAAAHTWNNPAGEDLAGRGLRLVNADERSPFRGLEPPNRQEHATWGRNPDQPYAALVLADEADTLRGHLCWFPLQPNGAGGQAEGRAAGIYAFWLEPGLRGNGLGSLLLDTALADMAESASARRSVSASAGTDSSCASPGCSGALRISRLPN